MTRKIQKVDTLVIGAGLIGSSVAMHLAKMGVDVTVVDFDLEGTLSSSELNAGGVRATWTQEINILASKSSIEYFAQNAQDVGYRDCGYLWLHPEKKLPGALQAKTLQEKLGWKVEAWDIPTLKNKVPFIDKTDGIAGAIFAPKDGLINPNLLKLHFRGIAKSHSAKFQDRVLVLGVNYPQNAGGMIEVLADQYLTPFTENDKSIVMVEESHSATFRNLVAHQNSEKIAFHAKRVINCAGAWAYKLAKHLEYPCPSKPVRRQVSIFSCPEVDLNQYGMIVDTSGVYFHPEATNGLAGFANPGEPDGYNYHYDGEDFFTEVIWPALYERSSKFERLKHLTGWAGLYEISPDESAIIGRVHCGNARDHSVYEAHSFSGHGAMHSYAAGLGLAELIVKGRYETIDFTSLNADRFDHGKPVKESLII